MFCILFIIKACLENNRWSSMAGLERRIGKAQMDEAEVCPLCQLSLYPIAGPQYGSLSRAGPAASPLGQCFRRNG